MALGVETVLANGPGGGRSYGETLLLKGVFLPLVE